tara:strand:+ start:1414 stop:2178 length:765 start_codon:yes stop_codon:yes gene_type:complete
MSLIKTFVAHIISNSTLNVEFNEYNNVSSVSNDYPNYHNLCPIFYDCVHDINSTITDDRDSITDEPDDLESSVIFIETEESCLYQNMAGIVTCLNDNVYNNKNCSHSEYGCCQISSICDSQQAYDDELKGTGLTKNNSLGWNFAYSSYLHELKYGSHSLDITKIDSNGTNCPSVKEMTKDYMLFKYHQHEKWIHQRTIDNQLIIVSMSTILLVLIMWISDTIYNKCCKTEYENLEYPQNLNDDIELVALAAAPA